MSPVLKITYKIKKKKIENVSLYRQNKQKHLSINHVLFKQKKQNSTFFDIVINTCNIITLFLIIILIYDTNVFHTMFNFRF